MMRSYSGRQRLGPRGQAGHAGSILELEKDYRVCENQNEKNKK